MRSQEKAGGGEFTVSLPQLLSHALYRGGQWDGQTTRAREDARPIGNAGRQQQTDGFSRDGMETPAPVDHLSRTRLYQTLN
jgi:hypothetical protein